MKPVIIIAIAFVLLIPVNVFAEECTTYECGMSQMYREIAEYHKTGELPENNIGSSEYKKTTDSFQNCDVDFTIITPEGWNKENVCNAYNEWNEVLLYTSLEKYSSEYPPLIGISTMEMNENYRNYVMLTPNHKLLEEFHHEWSNYVLESNITTEENSKTITISSSSSFLDSRKQNDYFELVKTVLFYSGEGYRFLLVSSPDDYESSKIEFERMIDSLNNVNIENPTNSEIICGTGTMMKNGQCVPDPNYQSQTSSRGGGCLIATATYGSELALQVQQLRELRDNQLLNTESGSAFMGIFNDVYYSFSPIIADYERENPLVKEIVKIASTPLISSLSRLTYVDMDSESEVLGYGISLILLNLGMYLGIPAVVIVGLRKIK